MIDQKNVRISREEIENAIVRLKREAVDAHSLVQLINLEIEEDKPEILVLLNEIDQQCLSLSSQIEFILHQILEYPRENNVVELSRIIDQAIQLLKLPPLVEIVVPPDLPKTIAQESRVLRIFLNILGVITKLTSKQKTEIEIYSIVLPEEQKVIIRCLKHENSEGANKAMTGHLSANYPSDLSSVALCLALAKREIDTLGWKLNVVTSSKGTETFEITFSTAD